MLVLFAEFGVFSLVFVDFLVVGHALDEFFAGTFCRREWARFNRRRIQYDDSAVGDGEGVEEAGEGGDDGDLEHGARDYEEVAQAPDVVVYLVARVFSVFGYGFGGELSAEFAHSHFFYVYEAFVNYVGPRSVGPGDALCEYVEVALG